MGLKWAINRLTAFARSIFRPRRSPNPSSSPQGIAGSGKNSCDGEAVSDPQSPNTEQQEGSDEPEVPTEPPPEDCADVANDSSRNSGDDGNSNTSMDTDRAIEGGEREATNDCETVQETTQSGSDSGLSNGASPGEIDPVGDGNSGATDDAKNGLAEDPGRCTSDNGNSAPPLDTNGANEGSEPSTANEDDSGEKEPPPRPPEPREIGGRRNGSPKPPEAPTNQRIARPKLICRQESTTLKWEVVLAADGECKLKDVQLEGKPLNVSGQECRIPSLARTLRVLCEGEEKYHEFPLCVDGPLVFKFSNDWSGVGHNLKRVTKGHFIVIAPSSWTRTGHVPVEPGRTAYPNFLAHHFYWDVETCDGVNDAFEEWSFTPHKAIEIDGQSAYDDCEEGKLFVGEPPRLKPNIEQVEWARVGAETKGGWGRNFKPGETSLAEAMNDNEGHLFLRTYDQDGNLLDSESFRYVSTLNHILVDGERYTQDTTLVPEACGYRPIELCFVDQHGNSIEPQLPMDSALRASSAGIISIPPCPEADRISCSLKAGKEGVDIVLDLPRIWWRIVADGNAPGQWHDKPLELTRQEFQQNERRDAVLELRSKRFKTVHVGFNDELNMCFRRKLDEDTISIPLEEFAYHDQIARKLPEDANFNVSIAGARLSLLKISADPRPEVISFDTTPTTIVAGEAATLAWSTRNAERDQFAISPAIGGVEPCGADVVQPTQTTTYSLAATDFAGNIVTASVTVEVHPRSSGDGELVALVRKGKGVLRPGKGFSKAELSEAGLTPQEAADRFIAYDKRRRSCHSKNVKNLQQATQCLK